MLLGLALGLVSGFTGTGGGFLMTPALIILGFPAIFAAGTSLTWVTGNSIVGALRHRQLGNIDVKLGLLIIAGTMSGIEVGVRILNWTKNAGLADEAVLSVSICILLTVGIFTFREALRSKAKLDGIVRRKENLPSSMRDSLIYTKLQRINIPPKIHFAKPRITISLWLVLAVGFLTGILAGFIGVGGGIIIVPSLIYLFGTPSFVAAGTGLFQTIFSAAFGSVRHTMNGHVIIFAAFILILGSSVGTQFGALATRHVRGISMRYILASSILVATLGSILKLIDILSESAIGWFQTGVIAVTFGDLGIIAIMIFGLFIMGIRYNKGGHIPVWAHSLVAKED